MTSGGLGGECMPTLYDDIYFDGNSGFVAGDSVIMDIVLAYCKSMDWTGALNNPMFTSNQGTNTTFFINGSVKFIQNMNLNFFGETEFVSDINGNTITSAGQHFDNMITLQGDGSWSLLDSMSVNKLVQKEGNFYSNGHSLHVGKFQSNQPSTTLDTLDLFNSNIYVYAADGRFEILSDVANLIYTNLDNTNFYYTSLSGTLSRQLALVLVDTAYVNEVIFDGVTQNLPYSDIVGGNNKVYINQVEMYLTGWINTTNVVPSPTDMIHISDVKLYGNTNFGGFDGSVGQCYCGDVYVAHRGNVYQGVYDSVYIGGSGAVSDGHFNVVIMNGVSTVSTVAASGSFFQATEIGTIILREDATIYGEAASNFNPLEVDTIRLFPGKAYEFEQTMTITQSGWIDAIGTGSLPIIMRSTAPGVQGTIKSLTDSICLNYIFMQDLDTAGTAVFLQEKSALIFPITMVGYLKIVVVRSDFQSYF
ncbi:MAG: hypothetical protein HC803_00680 [Saprospiraceae bacterium]|nr:hypothetical protein [Saprospiraceae bacterium]